MRQLGDGTKNIAVASRIDRFTDDDLVVGEWFDPLALVDATETLPLGSLAPGDKTFAFYRTLSSHSAVPILDNPRFRATLECDDIIGGSYECTYRDIH